MKNLVIVTGLHRSGTSALSGLLVDNTFIIYASDPVRITSGSGFLARFTFVMPVLPMGDYSISVAVAEGTQEVHIQQCWVHDALVFKVYSTSVCLGLIGVPMDSIELFET